jgi:uncharacterized protein YidB (DUF937 family)
MTSYEQYFDPDRLEPPAQVEEDSASVFLSAPRSRTTPDRKEPHMGMLEGLLGQVTSSLSGAAGQQNGLAGSVLSMLSSGQGLQGLLQNMEQQGLGAIAQSWVGTGANAAISPEQIQNLLGNEKLQELAAQHGINVQELSSHLAQILPVAVDKLTPNGQAPDANAAGGLGALGGMVQGLFGGGGNTNG